MEMKTLESRFRTLATLEETISPLLSCYINNENLDQGYREELDERIQELRKVLPMGQQESFEKSLLELEKVLESEKSAKSKGTAVFVRTGRLPFISVLHFDIPFETELSVDSIPHLYQLVLMKDTYYRYVVLISEESHARIVEVTVGRITKEVWSDKPMLNQKSGRGWTKQHYQNWKRDRSNKFLKEKIKILEKIFLEGRHGYLILAGNKQNCSRIKQNLPKHLAEKLIDETLSIGGCNSTKEIITASLSVFANHEQEESVNKAGMLKEEISMGGLAVTGTASTLQALQNGQVDTLVLSDSYQSPPGWKCCECGFIELHTKSESCPMCGSKVKISINMKEEILRLAEQMSVDIEIVRNSDELLEVDGIGCLLRYKPYALSDSDVFYSEAAMSSS